jgi:hypothetical protein
MDGQGGESAPAVDHSSQVQRRLATVQLLLSSERSATEHDILIATVVEALRTGAKSDHELVAFANTVWPGAGISEVQMGLALETAKAAGLIDCRERLDGSPSWEARDITTLDLTSSDAWAEGVVERCEDFLLSRGQEAFGQLDRETAHAWVAILEDALFAGIREAFGRPDTGFELVGSKLFAPQGYDLSVMHSVIDTRCRTEETSTFLKGMVLEALDSSNPFGSELVHTIATGYVLHLFISRRDLLEDRREVGSLEGQTVYFDTPILLRLLGPLRDAEIVWKTVRSSRLQGVAFILHQETLDELDGVLGRASEDAHGIEEDLRSGSSASLLADIVATRPLQLWLEKKSLGELDSWQEFRDQVVTVRSELLHCGVILANPTASYSLVETGLFEEFRSALEIEMETRPGGRGVAQIRHDASLLVSAHQCRQAFQGGGLWPGSVILTIDRALTPAYRMARREDAGSFPIAVTLSQWIGIITSCADPAATEELAKTVSSEVAYETLLSIAVRFPVESSRALARVLSSGNADSAADVRFAQMTIEDVLSSQPDIVEDPVKAANEVATIVIAERSRRMSFATTAQRQFADDERRRAERETAANQAVARREQAARVEAEAASLSASRRATKAEGDLAAEQLRSRRMPVIYVLMTVGLIVAIGFGVFGLVGFAVGTAGAVVVLWYRGDEWSRNKDKSWRHLLAALLPEVLGVFDILRRS